MNIDMISMTHGSGLGLSALLEELVLPNLLAEAHGVLEDAAVIEGGVGRLAFTTDSFVVQPLEFPGGDIGKLAACGTINDLAVMGATPTHLAVALILEEGLAADTLVRVLRSLRAVCEASQVRICCGDTKVVERGREDGLYINTSGIGRVTPGIDLSAAHARAGDVVIVSGDIGRHGIAILSQRQNLGFASSVVSDCTPLHAACAALLAAVPATRVMRDATRGGCAAVLNEIAEASAVSIRLEQAALPISDTVAQACAFLGMEPLQIANEGTFVAVVPAAAAEQACAALGEGAAVIGQVMVQGRFPVVMGTEIGGTRPVETPPGELLPRIC
jgi:hydrogenase expression/formation protein HypE